jgi:serine/threonine-protein kinase
MAHLWVATNQATGAEVCVKILVPEADCREDNEESIARFRREAHAAARLSHRAIVRVFDLLELDAKGEAIGPGESAHAYAIVMELLHGQTLGDMLVARGSLPVEEALDLFLPVLSALGYAHRASVIHRDLKPDNIFLAQEPDGHVIPKVLDFGVSKLESGATITVDGVIVGTPTFMSPEQAKGSRRIDARSDVFSAGILFYMMLTGRNPFQDATTFAAAVEAVVHRSVAPIEGLSEPIWAVLGQALQKDPKLRFNDATEMNLALRRAAGRRTVTESDPNLQSIAAFAPAPPGAGASEADVAVLSGTPNAAAARRRRTIVVATMVVASVLCAAALVARLASPAAAGSVPESASSSSALVAVATSPAAAPPSPSAEASASVEVVSAEAVPSSSSAPAPPPQRAAASGRSRSGTGPRHSSGGATAAPTRKPGQEPNKARDPGF